ncbi:PEP-CTERM sorting domain-containing protein [Planctomycetales bacterium ZRK34]|nr:PEP-CTERM sorting domain-containing protein [Planctomycetales bacterium ZRK34]
MSTFLRPIVWSGVIAVAVSLCCAGSAPAEIVVHTEASHANHRTVEGPGGGTQNFSFGLLAGGGGGQNGFAGIAYFKLPDVLTADSLTDADLQFTLSALGNSVLGNLDIYGLGYVTGTPSTSVPSSWYFDDANDTRTGNDLGTNIGTNTVTKIADNALLGGTSNPSPSVHSTNASQDTTLATFLRSLYTAGATANDYAVIRFNVDDYIPHDPGNQNRYNIGSVTSGPTPPSQAPVLTMTTDNPTLIDNTGITAIASSEWTNTTPHRLAIQAVNGAGLSGSEYTTSTHSGTPENVWLSGYGTIADQWIRVDLGDVYDLDAVKIWNDGLTNRQITQADIYVAKSSFNEGGDPGNPDDNPENWVLKIEDRVFAPYTNGENSIDILALTGKARYFAIAVDTNGGDNLVGLGELQFFGTVVIPEPSTFMLAAIGLLGMTRRRA